MRVQMWLYPGTEVYNTLSVQEGVQGSYCGRNQHHIITRKVRTDLYLSTPPIPHLYVHCKSQVGVNPPQIVTRRTNRGRTLNFQRSPSLNPTSTVAFFCSILSWSYFNSSRLLSLPSAKTGESRFPGPRKGCVSGRSRRKLGSPKKMRGIVDIVDEVEGFREEGEVGRGGIISEPTT